MEIYCFLASRVPNDFLTLKSGCVYFCRGVRFSLVVPTFGYWPFAFVVIVKPIVVDLFFDEMVFAKFRYIGIKSEQETLQIGVSNSMQRVMYAV